MTKCVRGIALACAAAAMAFGAPLARAPAQAAEIDGPKLTWNISTWGEKRAFTAGVERLSAILAAKTGGNWTLRIHYGEALSKSRDNLDGLKTGAFEGATICNFYHPEKNPALMALTLPFLPMATWEDNRRVREAVHAHPAVRTELARWNAMVYVSSFAPQYELLGKGKPPVALADWKGIRVRAGGGIGRAMKALGAIPVMATATEVYAAIEQGAIQAVAFPFTQAHVDYKIYEVAEWYTANLAPGTSDCPFVFSIGAYRKLPAQYSRLLEDSREEIVKTQIGAYQSADRKNLPLLRSRLKEIRYTDAQIAAFRKVAGRPVIEAWIEENQGGFDARGLVKSMFAAVGRIYE